MEACFVFGSSRPCLFFKLLPIFVGSVSLLTHSRDSEESQSKVFPVGMELSQWDKNPLKDGRSESPVLKKAYFRIEKETFRY